MLNFIPVPQVPWAMDDKTYVTGYSVPQVPWAMDDKTYVTGYSADFQFCYGKQMSGCLT